MKKQVKNATYHGIERMEERLSIKSKGSQERMVKLAYERGFGSDADVLPKKLLEYAQSLENKKDDETMCKIYAGAVYLFNNKGILITVWKLDKERSKMLEGALRKLNKRKLAQA